MNLPDLTTIFGVDFSGARKAGRTIWIARVEPDDCGMLGPALVNSRPGRSTRPACRLADLQRLEDLCGTADRAPALAFLVEAIAQSQQALWALDFPFGLPIELQKPRAGWLSQLRLVRFWNRDAREFGLRCLEQAKALGGPNHIRRLTDTETKTPFDTYHYRIIYQTFHGMRDVLDPLHDTKDTAILPFQYDRLSAAQRVVIESCPSSTLKRLGLPYRNYKQAGKGPSDPDRRGVRGQLLRAVSKHIRISRSQRQVILNNTGGDALDAVIAALGGLHAWITTDHDAVARHPRYPREGFIYA